MYAQFLYNKEDIISLGAEEGALNSLPQVTVAEAYDDVTLQSSAKRLSINKEIFKNITVLNTMEKEDEVIQSSVQIYSSNVFGEYVVYKISDDIFFILENTNGGDIGPIE